MTGMVGKEPRGKKGGSAWHLHPAPTPTPRPAGELALCEEDREVPASISVPGDHEQRITSFRASPGSCSEEGCHFRLCLAIPLLRQTPSWCSPAWILVAAVVQYIYL